jgi:Ca2+-binding RTX toxin-like protein
VNADLQGNDPFVTVDLTGGPFAPGATDEGNGSSEIEFSITNFNPGMFFKVLGSAGPDSIEFGDRRVFPELTNVTGANLNGPQDGEHPDEDVVLHGGAQRLVVDAGAGNDLVTGTGTGTALSRVTAAFMSLTDGPGVDTLVGGANGDVLVPQPGIDRGDVFSGGGNSDLIEFGSFASGVTVRLDDLPNDGVGCPGAGCDGDNVMADIEQIRATSFDDVLVGGAANNILTGRSGDNTLVGGPGDDSLEGGTETDVYHGGPGFDEVLFFNESEDVTVTLDGKPNDGKPGEHDSVGSDVEKVLGGPGDDTLIGNDKDNTLAGFSGDDVMRGGGGNDLLTNFANAPDGNDQYFGGPGIDTVAENPRGGSVDQILSIDGVANDRVVGGPPGDLDNIHTDVENVIGGTGDDRITGSGAANRLEGGLGDDTLIGLGGDDTLLPGGGVDTANGGPGLDTASFENSNTAITADLLAHTATGDGEDALPGIERLAGSQFNDHLIGSQGPNRIAGAEGDDRLRGLAGKDVLLGGLGGDTLDGGPDSDTCVQGPGSGAVTHCEH